MAHWSDGLERVKHPDGRILIGGSFRGVPFFVESHDRAGGRRIVTHEFAQSDTPAHDDMGGKAKSFRVQAYVLGVDYIAHRDALLAALDSDAGAGELIHPYLGPKRVRAGLNTMRESTSDGGIATFSIEFHDAPISIAPASTADLPALVVLKASAAFTANQEQFEETYSVIGQPSFAVDSLRGELVALTAKMNEGLAPIVEDTQELAKLSVSIDLIVSDAASLVRTPADIIDSVLAVVLQLEESILNRPKDVIGALLGAYDLTPTADVLGDTATRVLERANQLALSDAMRIAIVAQSASMITTASFETVADATELRDRVAAALESLALTAADVSYPALVDLRSAVVRAVPGDSVLASVQDLHLNTDQPSLLVAYRLYGSVDAADDITDRNAVQHPGFVSGDIEVLSFV